MLDLDRHAVVDRPAMPQEAERTPPPCAVTIVAHDIGPVGGMERQLEELAVGLRRLGHDVTVIARSCELPKDADVRVFRVWAPRRPFLLGYVWFMIAGSIAVRRRRRGLVQTAGAIVLNRVDSIAVHCCHQVYVTTAISRSPLARIYARAVGLVKRLVERACFRANRQATFVCVSNGVAEEIREHYPDSAERVVTIHNGVDLDLFAPGSHRAEADALRDRLGIAPGRLLVAFVGGNWEHKGLDRAIEARGGAREWDLLVAGHGVRRPCEELARSLGVERSVHWLGVVHPIHPVHPLADALVLPSAYETFSLVTFEAAASGLPLLATPVSGVSELLQDGGNGFLIEPDGGTIAEHLRRLGNDSALRERLGAAARRSALEFGWERMVARHHELYLRLAAGAGP